MYPKYKKKWEYKEEVINGDLVNGLNRLGKLGWEVWFARPEPVEVPHSYIPDPENSIREVRVFLKRSY